MLVEMLFHSAIIFVLFVEFVQLVASQPECRQTVFRQITVQRTSRNSYSHGYTYSCGLFGWGRCRGTRTQYRTGYYSAMTTVSHLVSHCCPSHSGTWPDCTPICNPACSNGGRCIYRAGGNYCSCPSGYRGTACENDINECTENTYNCHRLATCHNTKGSYECRCHQGYKHAYDRYTCIDRNECSDGTHECGSSTNCENTDGSFICRCGHGYQTPIGNPRACVDINECKVGNGGCQQTCINEPGYFRCDCRQGYKKNVVNLYKCDDIHECKEGTHNCSQKCENSLGSFKCGCELGCTLSNDKATCEDINECRNSSSHGCNQICTNLPCQSGRYSCSCRPGYYLLSNNETCADINECSNNNGGCQHTCINTIGNFTCSCLTGYQLGKDLLSCDPLPCPTLLAPANGYIRCSHLPVVVGSVCNFTCNEDYDLSGSSQRLCLSNTTWSGTLTSCQIKTCPQLQVSSNSTLVQSCSTSVNSTCLLGCDNGYQHDNGVLFEQTCTIVDGVAGWSKPETCRELNVCSPSPCITGTCSISDTNTASCICPSGFFGQRCQNLYANVSEIPLLLLNRHSLPITITVFTQSTVIVKITTTPSISIIPSGDLTISYPENSTVFFLHAESFSSNDLIRIKFQFSSEGGEEILGIEDKLTVASTQGSRGTYFSGSNNNVLKPGCCQHTSRLAETFCTSPRQSVIFSSSCTWTDRSSQLIRSNGIVFVESGAYKFPLSIVGVNMRASDEGIITDFTSEGGSCTACSSGSNDCMSKSQSIEDVLDMVKRLAMAKTLLKSVRPIISSSLTISIPDDFSKSTYTSNDYFTKLSLASAIPRECSTVLIDTTSTDLYYVSTVSANISFSYKGDSQMYNWYSTHDPICFMYPLCGTERTLFLSFPSQVSEQILNLTVFNDVNKVNWKVDINSIGTSRFGLPSGTDEKMINYWDGNKFTIINEPNYNLEAYMNISGAFNEEYLQVPFSFTGTVSEGTKGCQNLREIKGKLATQIITGSAKSVKGSSVLHLEVNEGMGYLTDGNCNLVNTFQAGLNINLFHSALLSNGSFSKYLHVKGTDPCLVNAHFQFQNITRLEMVSFLSECLFLKINKLDFSVFPTIKLSIFPNNLPAFPGRVTTVFLESRVEAKTSIGNFITQFPSTEPNYRSTLISDDETIFCVLNSANISLFDTQIITPIFINEQGSSFSASIDFFDVGMSNITGQSNTNRPWDSLQLKVNINLNNDFNDELGLFLNSQIKDTANETLNRLTSVEKAAASASERVLNVEKKVDRLKKRLLDVQNRLEQKSRRINSLEADLEIHEEFLHNDLENYWNATDELRMSIESVCQIQACEKKCKKGIVGTICFTPVSITVTKKCISYVTKKVTIQRSRHQINYIIQCSKNKPNIAHSLLGLGLSVITVNPIGIIHFISSFFSKPKPTCYRVPVEDTVWEPMEEFFRVLESRQCKVPSFGKPNEKGCGYTSSCGALVDDAVCNAMNEACYKNRTTLIEEFNADNVMLLNNIAMRNHDYRNSLRDLTKLSSDISLFKLQNNSLTTEINATTLILQNARKSEEIANKSLQVIKTNEARSLRLNDVIKDLDSVVKVTQVYFDVTVETQTPVIIPLRIAYEISHLGTSHEIQVVVDISASKELIRKTILDNIKDDVIDNIIGTPSRKRRNVEAVSLAEIFDQQCNLQTYVINYIDQISQSLSVLYKDTTNIITSVIETRDEEISNHQITVDTLTTLGTNLSVSFLENEQSIYDAQIQSFDTILKEINDSKISQWRADIDDLHSQGFVFSDQTCYSLSDCLFISLSSIRKLISPIQSINVSEINIELNDAYALVQELSDNSSWSFPEIQSAIKGVQYVAQKVSNLGYWCATPPVIIEQPPDEVEIEVGTSLNLSCLASSSLSMTYSWKHNNVSIPFATNPLLYLSNITTEKNGIYQCEVRNAIGMTTPNSTLVNVYKRVTFIVEPTSTVVVLNDENIYLFCEADTYPFPSYQWMYKPFGITGMWQDITVNGTSNTLFIDKASYSNEGYYRCKVENEYSSNISRAASLTVLPGTFLKLSYSFELVINSNTSSIFGPNFVESFKNTLHSFIMNIPTFINVTSITPINETEVKVIFTLAVSNYSTYHDSSSIEFWYNQTAIDLTLLQAAKSFVELPLKNKKSPFTFRANSKIYQVHSVIVGPLLFECPVGYEVNQEDLICVGCQQGQYRNNSYVREDIYSQPGFYQTIELPRCSPCPRGTYQPNKTSFECIICPNNSLTINNGSSSLEDCKDICAPGTVSDTGYEPCHKCNISYYQLHYGRKSCLPCFNGTSVPSCKEDYCERNHYSVSGFKPCTKCARGYYQLLRGQGTCQHCDYNGTVPTCVEAQCQPGSHSIDGLKPCVACPKGSYQLKYGQKSCHICLSSSLHIEACQSSLCMKDHYSSNGIEPCFLCEKGYYQPQRGQTGCIKCTPDATSLQCQSDDIHPCHLPPYTGPCNFNSNRYFYNHTSGICESFNYGGCYGNKNNFFNRHDCENTCGSCPPTCTYNYCLFHRSAICSMSPLPTNDTNCLKGCRLSNCRASYFAPNPIPMPVDATSCAVKNQCSVKVVGATESMDSSCMKKWGRCVYRAYHSSNQYVNYKRTPENFHCWEYNCQ